MTLSSARIALVHEWFVDFAGSEKVFDELLGLFPTADVFAVCAAPQGLAQLKNLNSRVVTTTVIQKVPCFQKFYKICLPLMPFAIEQLDLTGYDLVISSSHAVAKGVITSPDTLHVSYVHSPMRYAWDLKAQYLLESNIGWSPLDTLKRWSLHRLKMWDFVSASGVDIFVSNSDFIGRRIEKCYRRSSTTIYPPVECSKFASGKVVRSDFYICATRLVPYKKVDVVIEAFNRMPERKLIVVGGGPDYGRLAKLARSNIELLGRVGDSKLIDLLQRAKGFVFAAEEDFGILPVEAQAAGTPVIAYNKGGSRETVIGDGPHGERTGVFFEQQSAESIIAGVESFENLVCDFEKNCRLNASRFSAERFRTNFMEFLEGAWRRHASKHHRE